MKSFEFDRFDHGRVLINRRFSALFQQAGLDTFDAWMQYEQVVVAKAALRQRQTFRIDLSDGQANGSTPRRGFYVKRHYPAGWKDWIKPLLQFRRPMLGARPEWEALLRFHSAGVPTMTPAAFGEWGGRSFLATEALDGCTKLSAQWSSSPPAGEVRRLVHHTAHLTRRMHSAGLHHQDFYLGHLLQSDADPNQLFVIDLGRAAHQKRLGRRWIVKDLAQLWYSAPACPPRDALRFLRAYLGRRLTSDDRGLVRSVLSKHQSISRHTRKHGL